MSGRRSTRCVRAGLESDGQWGAVIPPIHLSSTFTFHELGRPRRHDYTRSGNPTRDLLGDTLGELEGGEPAVVTATGMAAITTVLQLLQPGDLLVAPADAYGGSWRLMTALAKRGAFDLRLIDPSDDAELVEAFAANPRMCWIETPSNPLLRVTDLRRVADLCAASGTWFVADNTFLGPWLQRPIEHGADIVVHSTTKYINGHSDIVGGAVVASDPALAEQLAWWANCLGVTGSPFDAWLTLRGVRTLELRCTRQNRTALSIVDALQGHDSVRAVYHPSLPDHPGHTIAARQQDGFGAMVSFELAGGHAAVAAFVDGLTHFSLAESLGGVESLVAHPATMTHAAMSPEARRDAGITEGLVRLSVGIEDASDLLADLLGGLRRAAKVTEATCLA